MDLEAEKKKFIEPFQLHGGRLFHTKVMRARRAASFFVKNFFMKIGEKVYFGNCFFDKKLIQY
jgi:hypothetical protein